MNFNEFVERVFCYMALLLTLYHTKLFARQLYEEKENASMMLEDYRIPLFVDSNGVILSIGQKSTEQIADEYMAERCQLKEEQEKIHWLWLWLQNIE